MNSNAIEKYLKNRIEAAELAYDNLIKPYYDELINCLNVTGMNESEVFELTNKRNCLLVQKSCYKEVLEHIRLGDKK